MAIPVHAHNSFFGMPKFDVCFYFSIQYIKKYDKGPKTEVPKETLNQQTLDQFVGPPSGPVP